MQLASVKGVDEFVSAEMISNKINKEILKAAVTGRTSPIPLNDFMNFSAFAKAFTFAYDHASNRFTVSHAAQDGLAFAAGIIPLVYNPTQAIVTPP